MDSIQANLRFFKTKLQSLAQRSLIRTLRSVQVQGSIVRVDGKRAIHLCSNDYLGLSREPKVLEKCQKLSALSPCSSRLLAGNDPSYDRLESALAKHRQCDAALVFPSGYSTNLGVIQSIADKNTAIYSDELNHASIIDACRLSGSKIRIFKHNDTADLEAQLRKERGRRKIIITEGLFSMNGDIPPLKEISKLSREFGSILVLDDAHADFIRGEHGSGTASEFGAPVDLHISSLSKALGCYGGYVAGSHELIQYLVNTSRNFIYTSALPSHLCLAALVAIKLAKRGHLQRKLELNIEHFSSELESIGFDFSVSRTQILPIPIGEESKAVKVSHELLKRGVFAPAIRYPTVKKGEAQIRVSLTSMHTPSQINSAVQRFRLALQKVNM